MKNKIVSSHSNPNTGYSSITIQNKYGRFYGSAFCCEEDMKNFSKFAGDRYAEIRASLSFTKFRLKQEKVKLKTIQNLYKDICNNPKCENDKATLRCVKLKLRDYTQSVSDWQNLCEYLSTSIKKQDEERQAILSRTKKDK